MLDETSVEIYEQDEDVGENENFDGDLKQETEMKEAEAEAQTNTEKEEKKDEVEDQEMPAFQQATTSKDDMGQDEARVAASQDEEMLDVD